MLEKIQAARKSPMETVLELQLDPDDFTACNPEGESGFNEGLPILLPDERLFSAAVQHAEDMVKEQYFSKISLDGMTPADRFESFSYVPLASGETQGVLLFRNYLPKAVAIDALFENIVSNEPQCSEDSGPVIFNPEYKEIGLSIKSGSMEVQGVKLNFYLAVVDLGAEMMGSYDPKIFLDINLTRNNSSGEESTGLPPFTFNRDLYEKATISAQEALDELFPQEAQDEVSFIPEEASEETVSIQESWIISHITRIWVSSDEKTQQEAEDYLLNQIKEFEHGEGNEEKILFNSSYTDAGAVLKSERISFGENENYFVHVLTISAGKKEETVREELTLSGLVYTDKNGNDAYDDGEGLAGAYVGVEGEIFQKQVVTDRFGQFSLDLLPGTYRIMNGNPQNQIGFLDTQIELADKNVFIHIDCEQVLTDETDEKD